MTRMSLLEAGAMLSLSACSGSATTHSAPDPTAKTAPTLPIQRRDPNARLEELVMIQQEGGAAFQAKDIHVDPHRVGSLQVLVRGLATSHTLEARKLFITSEALFVRVSVLLVADGAAPPCPEAPCGPNLEGGGVSAEPPALKVDLRGARLVSGGVVYPVARHAQLAEPRSMQVSMVLGDKQERTLYFELPESEVTAGLTLVLPAGSLGSTELKMGLL